MKNNLRKIMPFFSLVICVLIMVLLVIFRNYDSTSGKVYDQLNLELKEIEVSNSILSQKVASSSSIITIAQKAKLLGFISNKAVVSFYGPQPLAAVLWRKD